MKPAHRVQYRPAGFEEEGRRDETEDDGGDDLTGLSVEL